jgi:hypothetical protein
MAARILQFIAGGLPIPPRQFLSAEHPNKLKGFLAAAMVVLYVCSLLRALCSRRGR